MGIEGSQLLDAKTILSNIGIRHGLIVGDLGCGAKGYFTIQAAKMVGKTGQVIAFDILKSALASVGRRAKMEGLDNISTVWTDLEVHGAAKNLDERIDLALLFNTLYQSEKPLDMLSEAKRLIRPGGKIAVVEWKEGIGLIGPMEQYRIPLSKIRDFAKSVGLIEDRVFEAGPFHYGIVFRKN